jgi:3-dehydro-L-gulonate 2-dehydrogenase
MQRLPFVEVVTELVRVLTSLGFTPERARRAATLFAESHADGVASHGLNRFPRFVRQIRAGHVDPSAVPDLVATFGAWEQWDGRLGPGMLNAEQATARAMTLAGEHGIGLVALRNTNHWMRGGTYGWQAARGGKAFIGWTNTTPNMPPWGTATPRLGNNPLVVAIPRADAPVVLDMAMSQFSYGKLETLRLRGESLPMPGGYDAGGRLTTDPAAILATQRPLPIGAWKGASLALVLDLLAALLSGGETTTAIGARAEEYGLSQVFVALDVARPAGADAAAALVSSVIDDLSAAVPAPDGGPARYPGEQVRRIRAENLARGLPVDDLVWQEIRSMGA